ncbi:DUF2158 domain-containing protein [Vibrio alginolyticus]|jgi:uncharacterized protein YodC (DUF2158 family)|uniref:YodC family protein n=1 Tax=Vibrio harveyi group TaxID=717610 RepID=UPI0011222023|nr:DUF2158 domain-containing protein [Vibrio parahaemolyticus]EME9804124.1 DUF2158 domain-containing protein [Vibrio alginolyticus]TOO03449.1 DUF2158 domain-containing protein [Vibrio parahaemolyticus]TOO55517.1 DUF2158 domain-containing protein [Vibrio parahaemolyticus]TOO61955.1 DUF2158 domain-containing protein [Vibrio parahaemolyticus]
MFSIGDCVQLKSGGPVMTISDIDGTTVRCQWFDDKQEVKTRDFRAETLEIYEAFV